MELFLIYRLVIFIISFIVLNCLYKKIKLTQLPRRGIIRIAIVSVLSFAILFVITNKVADFQLVSGPSMEPTLSEGDFVYVNYLDTQATLNSLVLYMIEDRNVVGRVSEIGEQILVQPDNDKDAAQTYYGYINQDQINGKILFKF